MNIKTLKQMTKHRYIENVHTQNQLSKNFRKENGETENTLRAEQMIKDQLPFQSM